MTDYYLNVPNEETFDELKGKYPLEYSEGGFVQSPGWSVDIIGSGQSYVSSWDAEGEPTYTPIEGFLVNLRSDFALPESLKEYEVFPTSPIRVWA